LSNKEKFSIIFKTCCW